jgi:predicted Zn-dependent protease
MTMSIEIPSNQTGHSDRHPESGGFDLFKLFVVLAALLMGGIVAVWCLVNAIIWWMPPGVEAQLGKAIVPMYQQKSKSSPTQVKLNELLDQLEAQLPAKQRQGHDYKVLYIPDDVVNAAAIPGDRILIFKGLLKEAKSENEITMVLGHELGHFIHRDHLRGLGTGLVVQMGMMVLLGRDAGDMATAAASSVGAIATAQFSQSQERQADEVGLTLLNKVYGHAAGATDFFDRISRKADSGMPLLESHPTPKSRIVELNQLVKKRQYKLGEKRPLPTTLSKPA